MYSASHYVSCATVCRASHCVKMPMLLPAAEAVQITLIKLYQRYTFRVCPHRHPGALELQMGVTLAPKNGLWVTVHPRAKAT